ncbi:MAG: cell wall hydrolase [Proteobacteria bacterium]|nr:cell wall hydrolase [Pseudomonadota bacterium]
MSFSFKYFAIIILTLAGCSSKLEEPQTFESFLRANLQFLFNKADISPTNKDAYLTKILEGKETAKGESTDYSLIDSLPDASGGPQWKCLTEALYFEARGEPVAGQIGVSEVIFNRVGSNKFPNTICKVVRQTTGRKHACQFSYNCDGLLEVFPNKSSYKRVGKIARLKLDGAASNLTNGATFYHNLGVRPRWVSSVNRTTTIGSHVFYSSGINNPSIPTPRLSSY